MNSKERLRASLAHKPSDKVVVDFGATPVTGIHVLAIENLRKFYGLPYKPVEVNEPYQMLGKIDDDLAEILKIDVVGAWRKNTMFGFKMDR